MPVYNTSEDKKLLFLNVPFCVGTSINLWCERYISIPTNVYSSQELENLGFLEGWEDADDDENNLAQSLTANKYVALEKLKEVAGNNYFSFTAIRNPWDRAVSMYLKVLEWREYIKTRNLKLKFFTSPIFEDTCDFEKFISILNNQKDYYIPHILKFSMRNQTDWMTSSVDHIIRIENLQLGFKKIQSYLGVNDPLYQVPPKRGNTHWRDFYDSNTQSMVEKIFEKDISEFKYTFN
jgi:hypothetical protein